MVIEHLIANKANIAKVCCVIEHSDGTMFLAHNGLSLAEKVYMLEIAKATILNNWFWEEEPDV